MKIPLLLWQFDSPFCLVSITISWRFAYRFGTLIVPFLKELLDLLMSRVVYPMKIIILIMLINLSHANRHFALINMVQTSQNYLE
jgi:hypothetical protein